MAFERTAQLYEDLRKAFEPENADLQKCANILAQLKIGLAQLNSLPPVSNTTDKRSILLARETLELAAMLSVRTKDHAAFERHIAMLKTYYQDFSTLLGPSQRQFPILGLFLLYLLANNRMSEFHTELEVIPAQDHQNVYIKHPISLEQFIMEGNYNKLLASRKDVPHPYYNYFMDLFTDTVRREVARSSERAYAHLPVKDAVKMLMLNNEAELKRFADEQNQLAVDAADTVMQVDGGAGAGSASAAPASTAIRWEVRGDQLVFHKPAKETMDVPASKLIVQTLSYAVDLERIV